ncbi:MAG: CPBP family intramembrane metalloprotease [Deltaproteobacteria bacterium]|nr:CPBP family intramembrane metalloprotease [Deltaproteobacteria bacterium]
MSRTAFLRLEWLLSLALVAVSLAWAALRDLPLAAPLTPTPGRVIAGGLAGALLWTTIPLLLRAPSMRRVWHEVLRPFAGTLSVADVVVIAALSGTTEELFFRGVLLPETGVVASSLCFGALHALTPTYFAWATAVGAGMSALTLTADSLVVPIVAHATYNFGALLLLRRAATAPVAAETAATIASPHGIG